MCRLGLASSGLLRWQPGCTQVSPGAKAGQADTRERQAEERYNCTSARNKRPAVQLLLGAHSRSRQFDPMPCGASQHAGVALPSIYSR